MEREIKFRVWRPFKKAIEPVTLLMWGDIITNGALRQICTPESDLDATSQVVLMQFAGLLDKNGNEIYEGDVISHSSELLMQVVYEINAFKFIGIKDKEQKISLITNDNEYVEILGNIYEHPHLTSREEQSK